jgi:hypothetical protein
VVAVGASVGRDVGAGVGTEVGVGDIAGEGTRVGTVVADGAELVGKTTPKICV